MFKILFAVVCLLVCLCSAFACHLWLSKHILLEAFITEADHSNTSMFAKSFHNWFSVMLSITVDAVVGVCQHQSLLIPSKPFDCEPQHVTGIPSVNEFSVKSNHRNALHTMPASRQETLSKSIQFLMQNSLPTISQIISPSTRCSASNLRQVFLMDRWNNARWLPNKFTNSILWKIN